jgi:hypothetical protein
MNRGAQTTSLGDAAFQPGRSQTGSNVPINVSDFSGGHFDSIAVAYFIKNP